MTITHVSLTQGGSNAINQTHNVEQVVQPDLNVPLRFFRRVFFLRIVSQTGKLTVLPATTQFNVTFQARTYNALNHAIVALRASTTQRDSTTLFVTLKAPRPVSVSLTDGLSPQYYRLDGDVRAEEAYASSSQPFVDTRFALRAAGDAAITLAKVSAITLTGYPTGPRFSLAPASQLSQAVTFWQQAGEHKSTLSVNLGGALAGALQTFLDRLREEREEAGQSWPTPLDVALIAESDVECRVSVTQVSVDLNAVVDTFADGTGKAALRFAAGDTSQAATITLPRPITLKSATARIVESFRDERFPGNAELEPALSTQVGAYLGTQKALAQQVMPTAAVNASGVSLGLAPLASNSELVISVQEDWEGQPSGKVLMTGKLRLGAIGLVGWATVRFPDVAILPAAPAWIVVEVAKGEAIWLAESNDAGIVLLERPDKNAQWKQSNTLNGLRATHRLLVLDAALAASASSPARYRIGNQNASIVTATDGTRRLNLMTALQSYLNAASGSSVTVPLTAISHVAGLVTLDDLRIVYDL